MIALTHGRDPRRHRRSSIQERHAPRSRDLASHRLFLSLASDGVLLFDAHAAFPRSTGPRARHCFAATATTTSRKGHELIAQGLAALLLRELPAARVCDPR
ncbi:MAG: hypothetical protein IPO88_04425 [Nannocystis sp.]|uniref:hypothetical protein n=1 Tax=Nannocystis sp. TaxID=1962667 RepID=UPI002421A89D|nr:hypothetical protein [Nannocystis sp.]MBK9752747.1 hypothetical protein [Nannocystis sp.]